ncbi:MAG: sulfurtransferase TusA family protein [Candidatus Krumholzibacteriia bacterium]
MDDKANIVIDTRGLFCPVPIIKASDAMRVIEKDAAVEVISDDPAIEFDLPAWCESHGHRIESSAVEGEVRRYVVRKGGG